MADNVDIKAWHLRFAKTLRLSPEIIEMLGKLDDDLIRMWLTLCAMDGMDAAVIQNLSAATITTIHSERNDYLRDKYIGADSGVYKTVSALKEEVEQELKESRAVRSSIEEGIEAALKEQTAIQNKLIASKDELIDMLRKQIKELERRKTQPRSEAERPVHFAAAMAGEKRTEEPVETSEKKDTNQPVMQSSQGSMFRGIANLMKNTETKKFIDTYLKDDRMTDDQKDFLLKCLEEGVSVKEIEAFASPGLSVEMMRRLKEFRQKNGEAK